MEEGEGWKIRRGEEGKDGGGTSHHLRDLGRRFAEGVMG